MLGRALQRVAVRSVSMTTMPMRVCAPMHMHSTPVTHPPTPVFGRSPVEAWRTYASGPKEAPEETNFYGEEKKDIEEGMSEVEKAVRRIGTKGALSDMDADTRVYIYGVNREMMADMPESLRNLLQIENSSGKQRNQVMVNQRMDLLRTEANDTGTTGVQVAAVTARIEYLLNHCRTYRKDKNAKRRLQILFSRRRKMLKYIKRTQVEEYVRVLETLNIKPIREYKRHNTLAPVSVRDVHPDFIKRRRKYKKSHYQHLYDIPTAHDLQLRKGPVAPMVF